MKKHDAAAMALFIGLIMLALVMSGSLVSQRWEKLFPPTRPTSVRSATPVPTRSTPSARPSSTPLPSRSSTPSGRPSSLPLEQQVTVSKGKPVRITGTSAMNVAYRAPDQVPVVMKLDCSACTGPVFLSSLARRTPWLRTEGPASGEFLDALGGVDTTAVVEATGSWTLTLTSVLDLKPVAGPVTGTTAAVFVIDGPPGSLRWTWKSSTGDRGYFGVRELKLDDYSVRFVFGTQDEASYDATHPATLPRLFAVTPPQGTWAVGRA